MNIFLSAALLPILWVFHHHWYVLQSMFCFCFTHSAQSRKLGRTLRLNWALEPLRAARIPWRSTTAKTFCPSNVITIGVASTPPLFLLRYLLVTLFWVWNKIQKFKSFDVELMPKYIFPFRLMWISKRENFTMAFFPWWNFKDFIFSIVKIVEWILFQTQKYYQTLLKWVQSPNALSQHPRYVDISW